MFCGLLFHFKARKTELKWLLGVAAKVTQLHMSMKSHGHIHNMVHKPVNGNLYSSRFHSIPFQHTGPDREMVEAMTDVNRGHRESGRCQHIGQEVKTHWQVGQCFQIDLWEGSGLYKKLVIEVPGHADWSSVRVLVARPCSIRESITRS